MAEPTVAQIGPIKDPRQKTRQEQGQQPAGIVESRYGSTHPLDATGSADLRVVDEAAETQEYKMEAEDYGVVLLANVEQAVVEAGGPKENYAGAEVTYKLPDGTEQAVPAKEYANRMIELLSQLPEDRLQQYIDAYKSSYERQLRGKLGMGPHLQTGIVYEATQLVKNNPFAMRDSLAAQFGVDKEGVITKETVEQASNALFDAKTRELEAQGITGADQQAALDAYEDQLDQMQANLLRASKEIAEMRPSAPDGEPTELKPETRLPDVEPADVPPVQEEAAEASAAAELAKQDTEAGAGAGTEAAPQEIETITLEPAARVEAPTATDTIEVEAAEASSEEMEQYVPAGEAAAEAQAEPAATAEETRDEATPEGEKKAETYGEVRGRINQLRTALDAELSATQYEERGLWRRFANWVGEARGNRTRQKELQNHLSSLDQYQREMNDGNISVYNAKLDELQKLMQEKYEIRSLPDREDISEPPPPSEASKAQQEIAEIREEMAKNIAVISQLAGTGPEAAAAKQFFGERKIGTGEVIDQRAVENFMKLRFEDLSVIEQQVEDQLREAGGDTEQEKALKQRQANLQEAMRRHPENPHPDTGEVKTGEQVLDEAAEAGIAQAEALSKYENYAPKTYEQLKQEYTGYGPNETAMELDRILTELGVPNLYVEGKRIDRIKVGAQIQKLTNEYRKTLKNTGTPAEKLEAQMKPYLDYMEDMYDRVVILDEMQRNREMNQTGATTTARTAAR